MDTPTTAGAALLTLRIVRAAVDTSPDVIPADLKALVGSRPLTMRGGRATTSGRARGEEPGRAVSVAPWDSTHDGIPWQHRATWGAPPLLLALADTFELAQPTTRLDYRSVAYDVDRWGQTTEEPDPAAGWVAVHATGRPPAGRPRVGVIDVRDAVFPATPRGSHLAATAATVARQVADALDPRRARTGGTAKKFRAEADAYRAFADTAEAAIPDTFGWLDAPGMANLLAAHDSRSRQPQTRRAPVAATPYGTATAAPVKP